MSDEQDPQALAEQIAQEYAEKHERQTPRAEAAPVQKPYKPPFNLNAFIMRHRRTLMVISAAADIAILVAVGVVCTKTGYANGMKDGISVGHWHERERVGTQSLADSCNTLADAYDMAPASEKIARHEPLKMDRTPCADIQKLADRMKN